MILIRFSPRWRAKSSYSLSKRWYMNRCSIVFIFMVMAAVLYPWKNMYAAQAATADQAAITPGGQTAAAESTAQVSPASPDSSEISKGTTLIAEFSHGINAKKLKKGDKVKAVLTQDLV